MEYRLLGPVELWREGRSISIVGQKQRTLLAILVLNANQVVSHDRLMSTLWGTDIPASGRKLLHNHLWSLRRLLSAPTDLATTPAGYRLSVPPNGSDLAVFSAGTRAARTSLVAGDPLRAADQFREALALWRGSALAGTRDELVLTDGASLEELRITALADRIESDLRLGRHADLIGELRHLVTEYPLQERLRGQLMTALHHSGRTGEALEEYQIGRRHLRRELGLEPGQQLSALHQTILSATPTAEPASPDMTGTGARRHSLIPRQLPADIVRFTGREDSLNELDLLLSRETTAVTTAVVTGAPGIGKTALAIRWGHRRVSYFPDGQLHIDLRGYSPGEPVTAMQALHHLLHGLGITQDAIPHEMGEREALYRSLLADRRLLLVLDNASGADQIRPLLPGSSHCKVVVTSRDSLRGLAATHDVRTVILDVMSEKEALSLLAAMLGGERVGHETPAVESLARLCGYLPLALRLAAAHLTSQPTLPIGDFVDSLLGDDRLAALDVQGDPGIGVRSVFERSYQGLMPRHQRIFRMIGLHPGPDIGLDEIIVMTGETHADIGAALDALVNGHLVYRNADGRYVLHDLVWLFAREISQVHDGERARDAALSQLFDWVVHAVNAAMKEIYTTSHDIDPKCGPSLHEPPLLDGFDAAAAWLDLHYPMLMSALRYSRRHGWNTHAWQLAELLDYFFYLRNRIDDWLEALRLALGAVREDRDRKGEGRVLNALGMAHLMAGRPRECIGYHQLALDVSREAADLTGEAYALNRIGYSRLWTGEFRQAIADSLRAIDLYRRLRNEHGEMSASATLGIAYLRTGHLMEALSTLRRCLDSDRKIGNRSDEGYTLSLLGEVYDDLGDLTAALDHYQQAVQLNKEIGQCRFEANALSGIGRVYRKQGRLSEAAERHLQALTLIREGGDKTAECEIILDLGHCQLAAGDPGEALTNYQLALDMADDIAEPRLQGLVRRAIADAHHMLGRQEEAKVWLREALDILAPMGVPQAEEIAKQLR
ncbi:BTAD domain-containing putative transcriptional regulator [Nonomuraea sp. NPDC051941]|uniref:AfsR/SARP family transcriptional regulator n=1 Tax=Nonomuraea sp. NPDC051941 TaxID=3364373 RepID=UPI0037CAEBCB